MLDKVSKSKIVEIRADGLEIHPHAQRDIVPAKLKKITDTLDLDAVGVLHAVEYPINGVTKIWVIDGQHRLKALLNHNFGEWKVQVKIHTDVTDDIRASQLFLKLNDRTIVGPYDKFQNEAKAMDPDALGILRITNRQALAISRGGGDSRLSCIASLKKLYAKDSGKTLDSTLHIIKNAWGTKAAALEGRLIEGVGMVLHRHAQLEWDTLIKKLAKYPGGPSGLIGDARGMVEYRRVSLTKCVAERVIETYNMGRRSGKLDPL